MILRGSEPFGNSREVELQKKQVTGSELIAELEVGDGDGAVLLNNRALDSIPESNYLELKG